MNVHVSVLQEEEIKIGLESEIIKVETPGDYIPVPSIAEVGQTIVVKAVDDKGKPTEWKAVDMPSGGGASVELDTTLTQIGKAADAKAVGDALADKQPKGDYLTQNELPDMTAYRTAEAQNVIDAGKQDTLIQSGATIGQIAKITAVDENGKPTEWEAADVPSGGVEEDFELIRAISITESINEISISTDENGNSFSLKGVFIFCSDSIGQGLDYKTISYSDNNGITVTIPNALNSRRVTKIKAENDGGIYSLYGGWAGEDKEPINRYEVVTDSPFTPITSIKIAFGAAVSRGSVKVWGKK